MLYSIMLFLGFQRPYATGSASELLAAYRELCRVARAWEVIGWFHWDWTL